MIRNQDAFHTSVLLQKAVDGLNVKPGRKYIDATLGGGGHTEEILKRGGIVLGIDIDQDAVDYVREKFKVQSSLPRRQAGKFKVNKDLFIAQGNFADLKNIAKKYNFDLVAGILFDLGMSSYQIDKSTRGFSFLRDESLDMRMDKSEDITAEYIINHKPKEYLYEIFTKFSEELDSGSIAEAIVSARALKPIKTTQDLVRIIMSAKKRVGQQHEATKVFQALRIAVNDELENLLQGLEDAYQLLQEGGRLVVISFHSLEDRRVKLQGREKGWHLITKKPIIADYQEILKNPRSRSAKMRIFEKV
ncbi:16S rRNA (cytosine(1402)-N(4))-methyltransferase RsmH [Candidatus Gottesmanbacteria bacterium]|nr:16S rRNA (cytosine(1402)-N(4))-methyltransferase RsmH [Candidatus Gottesmanbacteria bacterium]